VHICPGLVSHMAPGAGSCDGHCPRQAQVSPWGRMGVHRQKLAPYEQRSWGVVHMLCAVGMLVGHMLQDHLPPMHWQSLAP
jgi:hypothetical protein